MEITKEYLEKKNIAHTITADGFIIIHEGLDLRDHKKITSLGNVTSIGGYVYVRQGATLDAAALTSIGGYVYVYENASFSAAALTSIGGYVYVRQGATLDAAALTDVEEVRFEGEFFGKSIRVFDGMGCVVLSEKERDGTIIRYCQKSQFKDRKLVGEKFYLASRDGDHAHAESIEEALQELAFKLGERDIDQFRNMPNDTVKTPKEWAFVYRVVTGACQYGTKAFMASKGDLKPEYTLAEIIEQTKGAYCHETVKQVVTGEAE